MYLMHLGDCSVLKIIFILTQCFFLFTYPILEVCQLLLGVTLSEIVFSVVLFTDKSRCILLPSTLKSAKMDSYQIILRTKTPYIQGIDGLRALAVLAVILFHLDASFLPGGFSGVDVFFVISGYVVSASLFRNYRPDFFSFLTHFYARRIIRIFPALIVCLIIVSASTTLFVPESWLSHTNKYTGLLAFFGISNIALVWLNDGYFSPKVDYNPFTHTWSLAVEEQFYLCFPLLLFLMLKFKNKRNLPGILISGSLSIFLILSLLYAVHETDASPDNAFYLLPSRFWELACGALLFQMHARGKMIPTSHRTMFFSLLFGVLFVVSGFIFSKAENFPFPWAILPVCGTALLICGVIHKSRKRPIIQMFIENRLFVYIGKISYSLYLWHWPVYVLIRWTIGLETILTMSLAIALTFVSAIISYHYIEVPLRHNQFILYRPSRQIVFAGLTTICMFCLLAGTVFKAQPLISLSVTKEKYDWYPYKWPSASNQEATKKYSGRKLFAIGDSHTSAYTTMLQQLSDEYGFQIIKFSKAGCGLANLVYPILSGDSECSELIERQLLQIESLATPGDILFLASLRVKRFKSFQEANTEKEGFGAQSGNKALSDQQLALSETMQLIKRLDRLPVHIIIDAPKPIFKSPPFRCSDWFNRSNPDCLNGFTMPRNLLLERRKPSMDSLKILAANFPKLIIWDPFPVLCDLDKNLEICSAFDDTKPLFFDCDHLSAHGNRILYQSFRKVINDIYTRS